MTRVALSVLALLLVACTVDGGTSTPTAGEAVVAATQTPIADASSATPATEPTTQPTIEDLYKPIPYYDSDLAQRVVASRIPPPTIEAANAEADLWLRNHEMPASLPAVFQGVDGSAEPRCIEVTEYARIRSGGFVLDLTYMGRGRPVLGLLSSDVAGVQQGYRNPLVVRMLSLDETSATHVLEVRSGALEGADGEVGWTGSSWQRPA